MAFLESPLQSPMRPHTSQFPKLGILLHLGALSQTPSRSMTTQNSTGMGHLLGETKIASKSAAEGPIHTHIHTGEKNSSKHKNIDLELNRNILLHVQWAKKAESVSAWAFSAGGAPEEVGLYLSQAPCMARGDISVRRLQCWI